MKNKGQSILEYSILIIVIIGVFLAMQQYVKRGIQGRWKASTDSMGDQYDPRTANTFVNYTINSTSTTMIDVIPADNGQLMTRRTDSSQSTEVKGGQMRVGALSDKPVKFEPEVKK